MTTAELLREARALFAANPSHTRSLSVESGKVCASLAIIQAGGEIEGDAYNGFIAANGIEQGGVWLWNAEHTTAEVLAGFDKAIAAEEAKA
jgi:hypothetical protein